MKVILDNKIPGELTTDHAASSYRRPVLVVEGEAYGPADVLENKYRRLIPVDGMTEEAEKILVKFWGQLPETIFCRRCCYAWKKRTIENPVVCPNCKNARWETFRSGDGIPGPKPRI